MKDNYFLYSILFIIIIIKATLSEPIIEPLGRCGKYRKQRDILKKEVSGLKRRRDRLKDMTKNNQEIIDMVENETSNTISNNDAIVSHYYETRTYLNKKQAQEYTEKYNNENARNKLFVKERVIYDIL
jgi:hypothetical protein